MKNAWRRLTPEFSCKGFHKSARGARTINSSFVSCNACWAVRRRSTQTAVNHPNGERRLTLLDLNHHDTSISTIESQPHLGAGWIISLAADVAGRKQRAKMKSIESDQLLAIPRVRFPPKLEDHWIIVKINTAVIVLLVIVAKHPATNTRIGRHLFEPLN